MDSPFHMPYSSSNSTAIAKGPFTPTRTRQSSASSAISAGRKSFFGNIKKAGSVSGRYSISGRSTQSAEVVTRSENNIVESFGLPLPVMVNETLTFSERNVNVSINCSNDGWAWAVCGRRLLVWQYKETKCESPKNDGIRTPQRRMASGQCRELTLPHCDIGHKASLVTVFLSEGQQMASCLSVSPTGDVRYWPSIAHDGSSIDESGILEGQEFDELLRIHPLGYILMTTTCSLVLLQFQLNGGRHTIVHRTVKPPSGFIGGIGKKLASIIIGMHSQDKENKFLKVCAEIDNDSNWKITVLSDRWIQRWLFKQHSIVDQFLFEDFDIVRKIRETFHQKIWPNRDVNEIEMWMLDMQPYDKRLIILTAAANISHTQQVYYSLITLAEESNALVVKQYHQIKLPAFHSNELPMECLKMKFIINRNIVYMYNEKTIYQIFLNDLNNEDIEKIEFPVPNDKIMSASIYNQIPLFFSRHYGLVSVIGTDFEGGDLLDSSIQNDVFGGAGEHSFIGQPMQNDLSTNLSMYDLDPDEVYNSDEISQMKAAFIYHLKRNTTRCSAILNDLFDVEREDDSNASGSTPTITAPITTITVNGTLLDNIVIRIAKDLAEDIPAADPRWEQIKVNNHPLGSSLSMQIMQQLKEKNRALNHFIDFLHSTELWQKFGTVSERGNNKSTCYLLSDINEKIIATIALKRVHNSYSKLIDEGIQRVLQQRNEQPIGNLTPQDLFYVKTTRIHEILKIFSNIADEAIQWEQSQMSRILTTLADINIIVLTMLNDVLKFRELKTELFTPTHVHKIKYEYSPWTAASGKNGIRDQLLNLINVTLNYGARTTGEPELRQLYYKQIMDYVDFVLNGRREYIESIKGGEKYDGLFQQFESQRNELILPFVHDNQYEYATKLAEKYYDFNVLVMICEKTKNQSRLDHYINLYKNMDFSQFAINWYLRENKRGDLFERFKHNQSELTKFLGDHPTLAWIQSVFNGDLSQASRILFRLAQNETDLIGRKLTMLSMAKLTLLAGEEDLSSLLIEINAQLLLIDYQNQINDNVLMRLGYDTDNMEVLTPEQIIKFIISRDNEKANEFEFRKALEVLRYVEDINLYRHKIWCHAILRDNWLIYNINAPLEDLKNTIFYKLVELNYILDTELDDYLPPIEDFLEADEELGTLIKEKSFQFLMKLAYEHINEQYKQSCE